MVILQFRCCLRDGVHHADFSLWNPTSGLNTRDRHKIPICPPDPPEVEEYVTFGFNQKNRLVEFAVEGVFP